MSTHIKQIILLLLLALTTSAQQQTIMARFAAANKTPDLQYDYKILLRNMKTVRNDDSTFGRLYCKSGNYIDSNSRFYTARSGNYFCRLDYEKKTAVVQNTTVAGKEMGIRFQNDENKILFSVNDSVVAILGGKSVLESTDPKYYRYKVRFKDHSIAYLQIDFSKENYKLLAAYIETEERDENNPDNHYVTRYFISNVKYGLADKIFDLSRIFTIAAGKTILNTKYSKYTLAR